MSESLLCWTQAIAAIRLRKVISGDVIQRENEPMDFVLLATMRQNMKPLYVQIADLILTGLQPVDICNKLGIDRKQFSHSVDHAVEKQVLTRGDVERRSDYPVQQFQPNDQWREKEPWPTGLWFEDSPRACIREPMRFVRLA